MDVKSSDQCSVPPSLHVDLKFSRPRPFILSSLANTLLDVAHHTYSVPSAKDYRVPKGFQSFTCSLCTHCSWATAHTRLHRQRKSRARNARTIRGLPPTPAYIDRISHLLAMLAQFVGSRPHPLTSTEKVTCSLCSHSSWAPAHTCLYRQK